MIDIYVGIAVVLGVSVALGVSAYRVERGRARWVAVGMVLVAAAGLVGNVVWWRHGLWPARWLPFSNMVVLADANPPLVGVLIGGGVGLMPGSLWRRCVLLVPLGGLCLWASYAPVFRGPPPLADFWWGGVCRQTSKASCVPASAATLLAAHGIPATESEMARLCLTSGQGTSARGLYRGLSIKTRGTPWRVEPFYGGLDDLKALKSPAILTVRLDPGPGIDPRYHQEWGWAPGVAHSVVFFRVRGDGRYELGDPAVGREAWFEGAMKTLWKGEGVRLVRREGV
jgi:hypothetical protein